MHLLGRPRPLEGVRVVPRGRGRPSGSSIKGGLTNRVEPLEVDDLLLFLAGHPPIRATKIQYYLEEELAQRAAMRAPASSARVMLRPLRLLPAETQARSGVYEQGDSTSTFGDRSYRPKGRHPYSEALSSERCLLSSTITSSTVFTSAALPAGRWTPHSTVSVSKSSSKSAP